MTLLEFEGHLRRKLEKYDRPRPFICGGNPLECRVFIVGINAATEMRQDFWNFWYRNSGFDKEKWLKAYVLERKEKPLKPNRTRRNKLSSTRQRIEWITESMKPVKALETNLFVKATPTADELDLEDRKSDVFGFLLDTIRPDIIFIHGNEVRKYFEELYNIAITKNKIGSFNIMGTRTNVLAMDHLSRGWSIKKSTDLGKTLRDQIIR